MTSTSTGTPLTIAERDQLAAGLDEQHRFRIEQIAYLDALSAQDGADSGSGRNTVALEVRGILLDGARNALARITAARHRLSTNDYGHCVLCAAALPVEELRAVPEVAACEACRRGTSAVIG